MEIKNIIGEFPVKPTENNENFTSGIQIHAKRVNLFRLRIGFVLENVEPKVYFQIIKKKIIAV